MNDFSKKTVIQKEVSTTSLASRRTKISCETHNYIRTPTTYNVTSPYTFGSINGGPSSTFNKFIYLSERSNWITAIDYKARADDYFSSNNPPPISDSCITFTDTDTNVVLWAMRLATVPDRNICMYLTQDAGNYYVIRFLIFTDNNEWITIDLKDLYPEDIDQSTKALISPDVNTTLSIDSKKIVYRSTTGFVVNLQYTITSDGSMTIDRKYFANISSENTVKAICRSAISCQNDHQAVYQTEADPIPYLEYTGKDKDQIKTQCQQSKPPTEYTPIATLNTGAIAYLSAIQNEPGIEKYTLQVLEKPSSSNCHISEITIPYDMTPDRRGPLLPLGDMNLVFTDATGIVLNAKYDAQQGTTVDVLFGENALTQKCFRQFYGTNIEGPFFYINQNDISQLVLAVQNPNDYIDWQFHILTNSRGQ